VGIYYAGFHHTVPTVDSPENIVDTELVMDASYPFPGKCAFRSHPFAVVIPGNHDVCRLGDIDQRLEIVHLQYRGIAQIARKVRVGTETSRRTGEDLSYFAPHWEAGSKLSDAEIAEVWENISHGRPDERIKFVAEGPIVHGKFLKWNYWNEDGSVPKGDA
ncbi:MAG: glycosyltransferase family 2 protein, partial [Rothia mucilaginosa]|nr:glycosyltransferase family 2 protein [Rothia mucilaginosa]